MTSYKPHVSIEDVDKALHERGYRTFLFKADGRDFVADGINVWGRGRELDRYPFTTVYAPVPIDPAERLASELNDDWLWGPSFEHRAPHDVELDVLVRAIVASLP